MARTQYVEGKDLGASDERPRLTLPAPFGLADVPALIERAERVLKAGPGASIDCDVADVAGPTWSRSRPSRAWS